MDEESDTEKKTSELVKNNPDIDNGINNCVNQSADRKPVIRRKILEPKKIDIPKTDDSVGNNKNNPPSPTDTEREELEIENYQNAASKRRGKTIVFNSSTNKSENNNPIVKRTQTVTKRPVIKECDTDDPLKLEMINLMNASKAVKNVKKLKTALKKSVTIQDMNKLDPNRINQFAASLKDEEKRKSKKLGDIDLKSVDEDDFNSYKPRESNVDDLRKNLRPVKARSSKVLNFNFADGNNELLETINRENREKEEEEERKLREERLRREKLLKEEQEQREREKKDRLERERILQEERERYEKERLLDEERRKKEELERLKREEQDRLKLDEIERLQNEELERLRREEEERLRREEEERLRRETDEKIRKEREEEEKMRKKMEEEERLRRLEIEKLLNQRKKLEISGNNELAIQDYLMKKHKKNVVVSKVVHFQILLTKKEQKERNAKLNSLNGVISPNNTTNNILINHKCKKKKHVSQEPINNKKYDFSGIKARYMNYTKKENRDNNDVGNNETNNKHIGIKSTKSRNAKKLNKNKSNILLDGYKTNIGKLEINNKNLKNINETENDGDSNNEDKNENDNNETKINTTDTSNLVNKNTRSKNTKSKNKKSKSKHKKNLAASVKTNKKNKDKDTSRKENHSNSLPKEKKKTNFNEFIQKVKDDIEQKNKKLENLRKEKEDKELNTLCDKPRINKSSKKAGICGDFLSRLKESDEISKKKKEKLANEIQKEREYLILTGKVKIKEKENKDSKNNKDQYKDNSKDYKDLSTNYTTIGNNKRLNDDKSARTNKKINLNFESTFKKDRAKDWVYRLYIEDVQERKEKQKQIDDFYTPSFQPNALFSPGKKNMNKITNYYDTKTYDTKTISNETGANQCTNFRNYIYFMNKNKNKKLKRELSFNKKKSAITIDEVDEFYKPEISKRDIFYRPKKRGLMTKSATRGRLDEGKNKHNFNTFCFGLGGDNCAEQAKIIKNLNKEEEKINIKVYKGKNDKNNNKNNNKNDNSDNNIDKNKDKEQEKNINNINNNDINNNCNSCNNIDINKMQPNESNKNDNCVDTININEIKNENEFKKESEKNLIKSNEEDNKKNTQNPSEEFTNLKIPDIQEVSEIHQREINEINEPDLKSIGNNDVGCLNCISSSFYSGSEDLKSHSFENLKEGANILPTKIE